MWFQNPGTGQVLSGRGGLSTIINDATDWKGSGEGSALYFLQWHWPVRPWRSAFPSVCQSVKWEWRCQFSFATCFETSRGNTRHKPALLAYVFNETMFVFTSWHSPVARGPSTVSGVVQWEGLLRSSPWTSAGCHGDKTAQREKRKAIYSVKDNLQY